MHKLTLATCESKLSIFWTIRLNKYNMNQAQLLQSLCCGTYRICKNNFLVICKIKGSFCKIQKIKLPEVASKSAWPVFFSLDEHCAIVHYWHAIQVNQTYPYIIYQHVHRKHIYVYLRMLKMKKT